MEKVYLAFSQVETIHDQEIDSISIISEAEKDKFQFLINQFKKLPSSGIDQLEDILLEMSDCGFDEFIEGVRFEEIYIKTPLSKFQYQIDSSYSFVSVLTDICASFTAMEEIEVKGCKWMEACLDYFKYEPSKTKVETSSSISQLSSIIEINENFLL